MHTREQVIDILDQTISAIAGMDLMDNPLESPLDWSQSRKLNSALSLLCEIETELTKEERLSKGENPYLTK